MQHISYILQDEYEYLLSQKKNLEVEYKKQSERKRNACEQWAETWHDNFDYEDAEYQQKIISSRINDVNNTIRNTKITLVKNLGSEKVQIWSTVKITIDEKEYCCIIWWYPTIPWRISYKSPLGSTLYNKKVGSTLLFSHNSKTKRITILSIT